MKFSSSIMLTFVLFVALAPSVLSVIWPIPSSGDPAYVGETIATIRPGDPEVVQDDDSCVQHVTHNGQDAWTTNCIGYWRIRFNADSAGTGAIQFTGDSSNGGSWFVQVGTGSDSLQTTVKTHGDDSFLSYGSDSLIPLTIPIEQGTNTLRIQSTSNTGSDKITSIVYWKLGVPSDAEQFASLAAVDATLVSPFVYDGAGAVYSTGIDQYNSAGTPSGQASWSVTIPSKLAGQPVYVEVEAYAPNKLDDSIYVNFDSDPREALHLGIISSKYADSDTTAMWQPLFISSYYLPGQSEGTHTFHVGGREAGARVKNVRLYAFPLCSASDCGVFRRRGVCDVATGLCDCNYPWSGVTCSDKTEC